MILGEVLLTLSMLGFIKTIHQRLGLRFEFVPIFTFSSIIMLLFIAGLLNFLPLMTMTIFSAGLVLFGFSLYNGLKSKTTGIYLRSIASPGLFIILGLGLFFALIFRDIRAHHYDNYSHWQLIVKQMYLENRLPNFQNDYFSHQSYPPGSALFIYYIIQFIGFSDGNLVFAQTILLLSGVFTLFAFCERNKEEKYYFIKNIFTVILVSLSICYIIFFKSIFDLQVDILVLSFGVASLNFLLYYKNEPDKILLPSAPVIGTTFLIKYAGLFYIIIFLVYFARINIKACDLSPRQKLRNISISALTPSLCYLFWDRHIKYVFPAGNVGKHAMSIKYYKGIFLSKTADEIIEFTKSYIFHSFTIGLFLKLLLLLGGFVFLYFLLRGFKIREKRLLPSVIFTIAVWFIYTVCLYGMYLFSMPQAEIVTFTSTTWRYLELVFFYLFLYLLINLVITIKEINLNKPLILAFAGALLCLSIFYVNDYEKISSVFNPPQHEGSRLEKIESALEGTKPDKTYAVYAPECRGRIYTYRVIRYTYLTMDVAMFYDFPGTEEMKAAISDFDYLVVVDEDEKIKGFIKQYLPEERDSYTGSYLIKELTGLK